MSESEIERIVHEVTQQLEGFLDPYLGRLEYGNLRIPEIFPYDDSFTQKQGEVFEWCVTYEKIAASSSVVSILYDSKEKKWGIGAGWRSYLTNEEFPEPTKEKEEIINFFKAYVLSIPEQRQQEIKKYGKQRIMLNIPDGVKIEGLYTQRERQLLDQQS